MAQTVGTVDSNSSDQRYLLRSHSRKRKNEETENQELDESAGRLDRLETSVKGINDRFDTFSADIMRILQQITTNGSVGQATNDVQQDATSTIDNNRSRQNPNESSDEVRERRPIDTSRMEKLQGDISLANFKLWRNRWIDFLNINRIDVYPPAQQNAALRMVMDLTMQRIVEFSIGIKPNHSLSTNQVLDRIECYIRSKRSIALDLVAFVECSQEPNGFFDDFYIRLKDLGEAAKITTELD